MIYRYHVIDSPVGPLTLAVDETGAVTHLLFGNVTPKVNWTLDPTGTREVEKQLQEYFERKRRSFDLRLAPSGTDFQKQVWKLLQEIPYGETRSYGQLAAQVGNPLASRAVGRANGTNPISIVVPCHRVIGANGTLTGYGGGLPTKQALLSFERGMGSLFDEPVMA